MGDGGVPLLGYPDVARGRNAIGDDTMTNIDEILKKATPRPWGRQTKYGDHPVYIGCDGGYGVAMMDGVLEDRHANADLICLAVNSYEKQRECIRELVEALTHADLITGYECDELALEHSNSLTIAIAKAKELL